MNKKKYEGKTVKILNYSTGRLITRLRVIEVIDDEVLYGLVPETGLAQLIIYRTLSVLLLRRNQHASDKPIARNYHRRPVSYPGQVR
jgi:hypothetical protein